MSKTLSFDELIRRVRAGDEQAAAELVRRYEPAIRDAARRRLANARLQPILDSMDISQSVLSSFFKRAAAGQYKLHTPDDLLKLLGRMARNKVIDQARKHAKRPGNAGPIEANNLDEREVMARDPSPSQQAIGKELLQEVQAHLSPEEWQLVELRNQGLEWKAISAKVGGTPQALRKKLARALDRVAKELGLDPPNVK